MIAVAGGYLYAITFHGLQAFGLMPAEGAEQAYGTILTSKASFVWMGSVALAFISIFIKESWRYVFYASPLLAPALFAVIFTLTQR